MKTKVSIISGLLLLLIAAWLMLGENKMSSAASAGGGKVAKQEVTQVDQADSPNVLQSEGIPKRPRLFKSTHFPPETPEEKAMWDWWNAMKKADPAFEWKTPIEFYGRVIDQFGAAVAGATVDITWTALEDSRKTQVQTDAHGIFQFVGEKGKRMTVDANKEGYLPTRQSRGAFEYTAFHEPQFHVPDKAAPVVFRLQKLMGPEPYYEFPVFGRFPADGTPIHLSIADGKLGSIGELIYRVKLEETGSQGPSYSVAVEATGGLEVAVTTEEFPFYAPESGYARNLEVRQHPGSTGYPKATVLKLYAKLPGGKYAYVGTTVKIWGDGREVALSGGVRYNEHWSRNLELDHRKWINR